MSASVVLLAILTALYTLRLAAHVRYTRRRAPGAYVAGRVSTVVLVVLFVVVAIAVARALPAARWSAGVWAALVALACAISLRVVALRALREYYSESIVTRPNHRVVDDGIYRYLRHPLHLALAIEIAALAAFGRAPILGTVCALAAVVTVAVRNIQEESVLRRTIGTPYLRYAATGAGDVIDLVPRGLLPWCRSVVERRGA